MKWSIVVAAATCLLLGHVPMVYGGSVAMMLSPRFVEIPIGAPVAEWFPVDIGHDNIWELAIRTAETPTRVGIYSPLDKAWRDGPRVLQVSNRLWTVVEGGDGNLDYFYRLSGALHRMTVSTEADEALWNFSDSVDVLFCWGTGSDNTPLLGLSHLVSTSICQTPPPGLSWCCSGGDSYPTEIVSALTGEVVGGFNAGALPGIHSMRCNVNGALYYVAHKVVTTWSECGPGPGPTSSHQYLIGVNVSGSPLLSIALPSPQKYAIGDPGPEWIPLALEDALVGSGASCLVTWMSVPPPSYWRSDYYELTFGAVDLGDGAARWSVVEPNPDKYTDLCPYDLNDDGTDELILVTPELPGWEIRDAATGTVEDTLRDAPVADMTSLPLFDASSSVLFLIAGSSLRFFQPDVFTGVIEDPDDGDAADAAVPRLTLAAFPNPFNAAVTLSWQPGADARSLTIYNILGQEVRSYELAEGCGDVTWDGRNTQGRGVASGVYFGRLVGRDATTVKLVLLR